MCGILGGGWELFSVFIVELDIDEQFNFLLVL